MRIVITVPWGEKLGGAEAMLDSILAGAPRAGHEAELVFMAPGPWAEQLARDGFRVTVIPAGRLRSPARFLLTVWRLARLIRRRRPDLVLNWSAKTQLYGAPAAVLAGSRRSLVWWQQLIPSDKGWLDRVATLLPAAAVGCYSAAAARAQQALFPSRRTFVVSPGTPAPVPSVAGAGPGVGPGAGPDAGPGSGPDAGPGAGPGAGPPSALALALGEGAPVVGIVGRLQPWKGQDRLLRAQALLRQRGQQAHTLIVGGDSWGLSPEYAASLPRLAESLGLSEAVTLTGEVPDAGPYVERMDVLVNASDPEPFGIVLLEAMARGVAVVAVDSGGPGEFIQDGRTGVLAPSGEPAALADALETLLRDRELRERIARAGRESFLADFTEEALQRRFFAELQALLSSRR
ncbi:MAG TPA: glycosyltransferase family 4 protein [Solirubrobacteraceae bacterium]|nr:glycosyltransferase family 4 protein [Solirubrobacteraceae bacterium]